MFGRGEDFTADDLIREIGEEIECFERIAARSTLLPTVLPELLQLLMQVQQQKESEGR